MDTDGFDCDDILSEMQYDEENFPAVADPPNAPMKRHKREYMDFVPEDKRRRVKRKLFADNQPERSANIDTDNYNDGQEAEIRELKIRPTLDRFVYGNEIINLRSPLPGYEGASVILTNIYNTFVYIVQLKSTLFPLKNRKLAIQLRAAEHNLRCLEQTDCEGAHIQLPRMVESLFSVLDPRNNQIYVNQLKPVSCVLNRKYLIENISFRSMEAKTKNESNYIELMFNNPFRFVFVGCAQRGGEHNKNQVSPHPFFGDYFNKAVSEMYEVLYTLVSKEIAKAKKELVDFNDHGAETKSENDTSPGMSGGLQDMEAFSLSRAARNKSDSDKLRAYLSKITLPLAKRENVDLLPTSGTVGKKNADTMKMAYLTVEIDKDNGDKGTLKMVENDVTEDAVYMSSYIRCRVLVSDVSQAAFNLQIYTRHAIKLLMIDDRLVKFSDFM